MRWFVFLLACLCCLPKVQAQKLAIKFHGNQWVLGEKTQFEIIYTDKHGYSYTTRPELTGRIMKRNRLQVAAYHATLLPEHFFKVNVAKIKPGETITISATYTQGKHVLRKDTTFSLPELIEFKPQYFRKDSAVPGKPILSDVNLLFADSSRFSLSKNPSVAGYFMHSTNFSKEEKAGISPAFFVSRYQELFIWKVWRISDNKVVFMDSMPVDYRYDYVYYGNGRNGRNGSNGRNGQDGGTGENAGDGAHGDHGEHGWNAPDVQVYISRLNDRSDISKVKVVDDEHTTIAYVDLTTGNEVQLEIKGGSGGSGGDGGNGGSGGGGDSDEGISPGTGGNAGYGGDAGNGGNGGTAIIYLDTFNFKFRSQVVVVNDGGEPGTAGGSGRIGSGGAGDGKLGNDGASGKAGQKGKETVFVRWEE